MSTTSILKKSVCLLATMVILGSGMLVSAEDEVVPNVTATSPKLKTIYTFDNESDKDLFWTDEGVTMTVEDGQLVCKGEGANWGKAFASNGTGIVFEGGKDYTVMMKYKSHRMTPEYQMVVFAEQGGNTVQEYCYRWGTADFQNHWSFQRDPDTGVECRWYGDFQYIEGDDYDIVAFHFYTDSESANIHISVATCEFQTPKPLELKVDTLSIYEGWANLSKEADMTTDKPTMYVKPQEPTTPPVTEDATPTTVSTTIVTTNATTTVATTAVITTTTTIADSQEADTHSGLPIGPIICIVSVVVVSVGSIVAYILLTKKKPDNRAQK